MAKLYALSACNQLFAQYHNNGGYVVTVEEGGVGLGLVVCFGEGLKTSIVREVCLNEWSSGHTIRIYNDMPKKYAAMLEKMGML